MGYQFFCVVSWGCVEDARIFHVLLIFANLLSEARCAFPSFQPMTFVNALFLVMF